MLKKQFKLPQAKGNFCFLIEFNSALPAKGAIFVIRPIDDGSDYDREPKCSLSWSKAAKGFFAYSPAVPTAKSLISKNFDIDFPTSSVEIEIVSWGGQEVDSKVADFTLISKPSSNDDKYTTFMGGLND
ncbi:hypothetical protein ACG98H_04770 [Corynebacterium sp. L4756]|uniref:hypothetical protein n=1 Tax=unclassified Corynebacterium TaxID=2624378 RepID=UPI00374D9D1D